MTIKELNSIVSSKNIERIDKSLVGLGYRLASKNGIWEFDPFAIANAKKVQNSERYEEVFDDKIYVGDIHSEVQGYEEYEFIVITVNKVYREQNNLEQPIVMGLYTNAPINEEYEREQNRISRCDVCKKQFPMADLCEINGKLVCDDCFEKDLQKLKTKGKSKLAKKVKR